MRMTLLSYENYKMATCRSLLRPISRLASQELLLAKQATVLTATPARWLNLQEYQSKKLMHDFNLNVQRFKVAENAKEADAAAHEMKCREYVIKAQILAGGRGKGTFSNGYKGGVHLTQDPKAVGPMVEQMVGNKLTTKQTPAGGVLVQKVMVAESYDIDRETYLAILLDRDHGGPVIVGSPAGGMDIEDVADKTPELIFTEPIDILTGVTHAQAMKMAKNLNFKGPLQEQAAGQIINLYDLFKSVDATQVEINPFGETPEGRVVCFDAKINFDDNAQFRQKEVFALDDMTETDAREADATNWNLNYIGMDGNIACLVNGAGLAMATMDIIKLNGGVPANFLDVGGNVSETQVKEAFRIISSDENVKAILVNIFGGIVNCATIANGITNACQSMHLTVPLVVRLAGTNVDAGKKILADSGLPITSAEDLDDAAKKAVASLIG